MHDEFATHDDEGKRKLLENLDQLEHNLIHLKERHVASLAGSVTRVLLQSRAQAESLLSHSSPLVRRAAIIAIVDHWGSSPAFEKHCINILLDESDIDLQISALSAITKVYEGTADARIGQILKTVLRNQTCPQRLAAIVYLALFRVFGKPVDSTLRMKIMKGNFQYSTDIDWELVDSLAEEKGGGKERE